MSRRDRDDGPSAGERQPWEPTSWEETRLARRSSSHDGEAGAGDEELSAKESAEIDELVRVAMRALDARVPVGTFEALPGAVDAAIERAATEAQGVPEDDEGHAAGARPARRRAPVARTDRHAVRTEVVVPAAWWQSRLTVIGVGAATLAAAAALVSVLLHRRAPEATGLGASTMRDPPIGPGSSRRVTPVEEPDPAELERRAVLAELAPVLPAARACVGARPPAPISLELTVSPEGVIRDVVVQGPLPRPSAARCIADAIHGLDGKLVPRARPQSVRVPLY